MTFVTRAKLCFGSLFSRWVAPLMMLALLSLSPIADAQDQVDPAEAPSAETPKASKSQSITMFDETTGERYTHVRPTERLKQGSLSVSIWMPWAIGGVTMILCGFFLVRNLRRKR